MPRSFQSPQRYRVGGTGCTVGNLHNHGRARTQTHTQYPGGAALDDRIQLLTQHRIGHAGSLDQLGVVDHRSRYGRGARIRIHITNRCAERRIGTRQTQS